MDYFEDARDLSAHAREILPEIESSYEVSLGEQEIKPELRIRVKNFMENLRSALEYAAHGLFHQYGVSPRKDVKVYFPYAQSTSSLADFRRRKRIDNCIPGLTQSRPDIALKIESYQHFADPRNDWLPIFMELNNENKHQRLIPQTKRETKQLKLSSGGASVSIGQGASISIGPGASMRVGGMLIPGGQRIDVDNPPLTVGVGKKEVITWVSFHFSTNDAPVMPLLKQALEGVTKIVDELSRL